VYNSILLKDADSAGSQNAVVGERQGLAAVNPPSARSSLLPAPLLRAFDERIGQIRVVAWASAVLIALAVTVGYLLPLVGHLRLVADSISYLLRAESMAAGTSYHAPPDTPNAVGYSAVIAALDVIGLARTPIFVALQLVALAAGLPLAWWCLRHELPVSPRVATAACAIMVLSPIVVVVAAYPLSDLLFFATATSTVALLIKMTDSPAARAWPSLAGAGLLAAGAISLRSVGIVLVGPLLAATLHQPQIRGRMRRARGRLAALLTVAGAGAALTWVALTSDYVGRALDRWSRGGVTHRLVTVYRGQADALAQAILGIAPDRMPGGLDPILTGIGVATLCLVLAALVVRRRRFGVLDAYVATASVVLLAWPLPGPRLWAPLLPFVVGYAFVGLRALTTGTLAGAALVAVLAIVAVTGAHELVDSGRLALAGDHFADEFAPYSDPQSTKGIRASYRVAFGIARPGDAALADFRVVHLIRRYDR
jgi:hypothetical protein